jgi:hypothetical protein
MYQRQESLEASHTKDKTNVYSLCLRIYAVLGRFLRGGCGVVPFS